VSAIQLRHQNTRRCDQKMPWPTARAAVTSARRVPERQTDTRHPDVAQVAKRCCERNQLLLGSATTAEGLFNGTFCEVGVGASFVQPRGSVYCAVRAASSSTIRVIFYFSFKGSVTPVSSCKVISDIFGPALRNFHSSVFSGLLVV
jgi:hypothetical protein